MLIIYNLFCFERFWSDLNYSIQRVFLFTILPPSTFLHLALLFLLGFPTCILICREMFPKFFNSLILVQLIIFLCEISSFMCIDLMLQNFSCHLCVPLSLSNICILFISLHRCIFLFLHLSLHVLVSKFAIQTLLTHFSCSYYNSIDKLLPHCNI